MLSPPRCQRPRSAARMQLRRYGPTDARRGADHQKCRRDDVPAAQGWSEAEPWVRDALIIPIVLKEPALDLIGGRSTPSLQDSNN